MSATNRNIGQVLELPVCQVQEWAPYHLLVAWEAQSTLHIHNDMQSVLTLILFMDLRQAFMPGLRMCIPDDSRPKQQAFNFQSHSES